MSRTLNLRRSVCFRIALFFIVGLFLFTTPLLAQRNKGDVGLGIQFGRPSGLTIKISNPGAMSVDFLAAWDLDDFFFLNVHGLFEKQVGTVEDLYFFYGPGAFVGIRDRHHPFRETRDDIEVGISGTIGLSYLIERFEIYLRLTPRLALIEATDADFGGGLGFRYFFK